MMRKILGLLFAVSILTACANASELTATPLAPASVSTDASPASESTTEADPATPALTESVELSTPPAPNEDLFTQMGITLPTPTCNSLTPSQTEGPYYTSNTPERNSLLEEGMPG